MESEASRALGEFLSADELRARVAALEPCAALDLVEGTRRRVSAEAEAITGVRCQVLLDCQERNDLTATQLAKRLGLPVETSEDKERSGSLVRQWLKDARDQRGERSDRKGGRPDEYADTLTKDRLAELLVRRQTVKEIAAAYETSTTTVSRYLRRYEFSSRRIREALSDRTDPDRLKTLAGSEDELVRAAVAANPESPPPVLGYLAGDRDPIVHRQVAANPSTPREALDRLARSDDQPTQAIAGAATTPAGKLHDVLQTATEDGDDGVLVRLAIAQRPDLPGGMLAELANDKDPSVRAAARSNDRFEEKGVAAHAGLLAGPE